MCVYLLLVPISSLSISLPPGSWPLRLLGLQAWSYRSGPCQPHWDTSLCVCVCVSVCASICYNWGASCDRSPPTLPLWERTCMSVALVTHYRCSVCSCVCFSARPPQPPTSPQLLLSAHPPTSPLLSVYSEPDGVPGSPLTPDFTVSDGTASSAAPLLLYPDGHLTRVRAHSLGTQPPRTWAS